MAPKHRWERVFRASLSELSGAASWVESIGANLNLPESQQFAIQICLEELMSNIVRHGQSVEDSSHPRSLTPAKPILIFITVNAFEDKVTLTVEDNGAPFNVAEAPAKGIDQPLDKLKPGGLGIQLIKSFADNLEYRRTSKGNCVVAEFLA
jgi:anti-sigma regulatory factor (Ser/Thr protein kinase)